MQLPLQVSFRNMDPSETIESLIRDKSTKLDQFASDIMSCRVVIEPAGKHHRQGNPYEVRIDLTVPGEEIAITREPAQHTQYKDIQVAIRDAFDSARRKLEDYVRRRRGDVKSHEPSTHGRVSQIFPDAEYGFIKTPDGRDVFFHRNSVLDDAFDQLEVGTEVTFVEEEGQKGPQASTVRKAWKPVEKG